MMARRPEVFSKPAFQKALRLQGCAESFISPITSDFRLFVPLVISRLGEDAVFKIVEDARRDLGLGPQEPAWREAVKHIVLWAEEAVATYRRDKCLERTEVEPDDDAVDR
jgi:hypothetical protein